MLNIAVCDDEEVYLEEISDLIYQNASQDFSYNINKYLSGEELIDNFKNEKIDILFLDIEMKVNITKFKSHRYSLFEPPVFMN